MGDGSAQAKNGLIICTDCYSTRETIKLMNVLIIRYGLNCTLHKKNSSYRIHISQKSMANLLSIVESYMCPSMMYKIKKR